MKKKRNLYILAFLCFITLVGVTIAYLQSTATFENLFNAGTYKTVTSEEFTSPTNWTPGDVTPKTITTKNEGTIPVRVRVKLEQSWKSKNNTDLNLTYNGENVAIINFDNESDWFYDGEYYYYLRELAPGESTSSLIESVTFNPNYQGNVNCITENGTVTCESSEDGYAGGTYKLKITTETVQANKYETIWENVPIIYDYVGDNPCTFEGELVPGAEYVNGQYTYRYMQELNWNAEWIGINDLGWGVSRLPQENSEPVNTTLCSSINNKPIVSMARMFEWSSAPTIDLSSFDTSNVTNMEEMFRNSEAVTLDLSSFDISNVKNTYRMFYYSKATTLNLSSFKKNKITNMGGMFENSEAEELDLSNFDTSYATDMGYMFRGSKATLIDLSNFNTSNVTNMSDMFYNTKATSLDLSSFDTSNVTDMGGMFYLSKATTINLSSFDTSNVTDMGGMFGYCQVPNLDLSGFNTTKVTNMMEMFRNSTIPILDLSSFDITYDTTLHDMFKNSQATTGYAKDQFTANKLNSSSNKPSTLTFVVKGS